MVRVVAGRIGGILIVLVGVTFIVQLLIHLVPGDPIDTIAGQSISDKDRAVLRQELGLDEGLLKQYIRFVNRTLHFDLGRSFITRKPIADSIIELFPRTLFLATAALAFAIATGLTAGAFTAAFPRTKLDRGVMLLSVAGVSAPVFVTALGLRYIFAERLPLLPPAGYGPALFVILPAVTLGSRSAAYLARITRTTLLDVLSEDYIRTARAKGLSRMQTLLRHAFKNAAGPIISTIVLDFAMYLNGSVITESIFAWPGLGRFAITAIMQRDLPKIQAVLLVMAVIYVMAIATSDLLRVRIDPRLR